MVLEKAETEIKLCETSQTQEIYFEEPQILQVLLVPLDNGTVCHAPVLDGDDVAHGFMPQKESAGVNGEMAGKIQDLINEPDEMSM